MEDFKIGDIVFVNDNGGCYSTYESFFEENGLGNLVSLYKRGDNIPKNEYYTIVGIGKSNYIGVVIYVLKDKSENHIYLMNNNYCEIEKTKESAPLTSLTPKYLWQQQRLHDIKNIIKKYIDLKSEIPAEWIEEYNELIKKLIKL